MVYFITDGTNYVKIGYANDVNQRIKSLQAANPRNLYCMLLLNGDIEVEHMLHDYFKDYRIKLDNTDSCEWFFISGELKLFLDIDSETDIEDYLSLHFPRRHLRVISKKENYEKELYFYKTQYRKQHEKIKELENKIQKQTSHIKRLNTKLQKYKEKNDENIDNKRSNERIQDLQEYIIQHHK